MNELNEFISTVTDLAILHTDFLSSKEKDIAEFCSKIEKTEIKYNTLKLEIEQKLERLNEIESLNLLVFLDRIQHDIDRDNHNNGYKGRHGGHQIIGLDYVREKLEKLGLKHDENEEEWKKAR